MLFAQAIAEGMVLLTHDGKAGLHAPVLKYGWKKLPDETEEATDAALWQAVGAIVASELTNSSDVPILQKLARNLGQVMLEYGILRLTPQNEHALLSLDWDGNISFTGWDVLRVTDEEFRQGGPLIGFDSSYIGEILSLSDYDFKVSFKNRARQALIGASAIGFAPPEHRYLYRLGN